MARISLIDEKTKEIVFISKSKVFEYDEKYEIPKEIAIALKNYIEYGKANKR